MIHNAILFALLSSLGRGMAMALMRKLEEGELDEQMQEMMREIYIHAHNARNEADEQLMVVLDEIMVMAQAVIRARVEDDRLGR